MNFLNLQKSLEFVNCRELVHKNQYYKLISDGGMEHNYRLLIHQLQKGSLLIPLGKTVYQTLNEKILKTSSSLSSSSPQNSSHNFKIFQKLFENSSEKLSKDLKEAAVASMAFFVPTDHAFESSLRRDQIDSLLADHLCAYKLLAHNIVYEEICPHQLLKYAGEHSSSAQRANFIAVNEEASSSLFFNGQVVDLARSSVSPAADGIIYRLATLKLNGVVDSLYDVVNVFKKEFPAGFIAALNPNWLEVIKSESTNATLLMPFEKDAFGVENNKTSSSSTAAGGRQHPKLKDHTGLCK